MKTWELEQWIPPIYLASEKKSYTIETQNNPSITGDKLDNHSILFTNSCHDKMATPRLLIQELGIL